MSAQHVQDLTGNLLALLNTHQAGGDHPTPEQLSAIKRLSGVACASIIQAMAVAAVNAEPKAVH